MKVDMSPQAITRRLRRVSELVRVCRALAGPRRRQGRAARNERTSDGVDSESASKIKIQTSKSRDQNRVM